MEARQDGGQAGIGSRDSRKINTEKALPQGGEAMGDQGSGSEEQRFEYREAARLESEDLLLLVFHDALVPFCSAGDDYTVTEGTGFVDKVLRDLLRGIPPMYFLNLRDHDKWRQNILDSYAVMSDPAAAVMYEEMTNHEWVTDDQMVQNSAFSSGVEITVNFDEIDREGLPGKAFRVSGMDDGPREGSFVSRWDVNA